MRLSLRAVFFGLLALFLISALIGALISYNPSLAWSRFAAIVVSIAVCMLIALMPEDIRAFGQDDFPLMRVIFAFLPIALLIYFAFTNDWSARIGKIAWLDPILRWLATWQPRTPGIALNSNAFGGVLALLIPLQFVALWQMRARIVALVLLLVSLIGLMISASRGAWIAVTVVAWVMAMWVVLARIMPGWQRGRARAAIWIALIVYLAVTIGVAITLTPLGAWLLSEGGGHWQVARQSFDLVSDYPLTGIGLGTFTMAYSSYVLLVHVPHTIHAHNLFLDIWIEQGLLGLMMFAGLMIAGVANISNSRWRVAALASLGVMFIHGWLDDPFYGYGGNAIPFVLIPLGLLARDGVPSSVRVPRWFAPALAGALAIIGLLVPLVPTTRAMLEANLGALAQTRAELSVYEWPRYAFQDQLRRDNLVDLDEAIMNYERALVLDAGNVSAHRRLGQIALARGDYSAAQQHFESAFARAPQQLATRMLMGELYALKGDVERAVVLWRGVDESANPLQTRLWWYEFLGDQARLARLSQAVRLLR